MAAGKKEMANKTLSLRPSCSKDTFASMLAEEFNDIDRTAGTGDILFLFSRKNAMLGSLPWMSSPRRAGPRRGMLRVDSSSLVIPLVSSVMVGLSSVLPCAEGTEYPSYLFP